MFSFFNYRNILNRKKRTIKNRKKISKKEKGRKNPLQKVITVNIFNIYSFRYFSVHAYLYNWVVLHATFNLLFPLNVVNNNCSSFSSFFPLL